MLAKPPQSFWEGKLAASPQGDRIVFSPDLWFASRVPPSAVDRWLAPVLFLAGAACVMALPYHLGDSDESLLLYETLRIMRGEVYFAEVFNNIPPGAHAVFALLFSLFGASIGVARAGIAAVHGSLVLLVYACARLLGVRRALAAAAGLAHLALAQSAFPYASPHWLSTLLSMLLLWLALRRPWAKRASGAAWLGLTLGALAAVHHHKAAVLGVGVLALLAADRLLDRRYPGSAGAPLAGACAWLAAGVLALALPFYGVFIARSGFAPFYTALIEFPLVHYRASVRASRWGEVRLISAYLAAYTWPRLLAALPLALLPVVGRAIGAWQRRRDATGVRRRVALLVLAGFAVLSARYDPDFIHLAFIAPLLLVALADDLEWLLDLLPGVAVEGAAPSAPSPNDSMNERGRRSGPLQRGAVAVVIALLGVQIATNLTRSHREYGSAVATPFGRVALRGPAYVRLVEQVQRLADAAPNRQLFVYPGYPALYLMTGTDNPTPFQILLPGYNPQSALDDSLALLRRKQPPLVVMIEALVGSDDAIVGWVRANYEPVGPPAAIPGSPTIYRRREGP